MANPRVFEFAKDIGMTPLALMDKIREWQLPVKSHMAELPPELLEEIKVKLSGRSSADQADDSKAKKAKTKRAPAKKTPAKKAAAKEEVAAAASPGVLGKTSVVRRKTRDGDEVKHAPIEPSKARIVRKVEAAAPAQAEPEEVIQEEVAAEEAEVPVIAKETLASKTEEVFEVAAAEPSVTAAAIEPASEPVAESPAPSAAITEEAKVAEAPARATEPKLARKKEVTVGTSGVASTQAPVSTAPRRNIIGRMDLSRVSTGNSNNSYQRGDPRPPPSGAAITRPGAGGAPGGYNRPQTSGVAGRNVRAGFVASAPMPPDFGTVMSDDDRRKDVDKKAKKTLGAGGSTREEAPVQFNAVEFRKKEMVFQPRKKQTTTVRSGLKTQITKPSAAKRIVKVYGSMKLSALADEIGVKAPQLLRALMGSGVTASMNTSLDFDTIALIVPEFGWEAQNVQKSVKDLVTEFAFGDLTAEMIERPPVVAVMGHVDHGKTSLLDAIRKADVAAGEAGGITQHIGAYSVEMEDKSLITFLDTPGHEAFTAMRARGANVTDIAVIVVAADDGVMPQTAEAINHAKAAGVPLIIAVNKIDKPGANVEKIKQQLTEYEVVPEEWGGTTIFCEVSALKKTGIKELLEQIKLVAEVQEIKANPLRSGTGTVIEAKVEKGKGSVATILVKDGTVKVGQTIVAGQSKGRIRSLMNDKGERVKSAGPGLPVEVQGLEATPMAGDRFDIVQDDKSADALIEVRKEIQRAADSTTNKLSLEQIFAKATQGDVKELAIVLKADVQGSVEAITGMLGKLVNNLVKTKIIHSAVGPVNESDVLLAHTAKGLVIGFNVRPDTGAQTQAKRLEIEIRTYSVVYELIDDMKKALSGLLTPDIVEKILGRVEVRNTFTVPKIGTIAGCFVTDGKVTRSAQARLLRDGKIIYEGRISSLKRFKDDAKEVATGFECGIGIENFNDIKAGDNIEIFTKEEVAKELELGV